MYDLPSCVNTQFANNGIPSQPIVENCTDNSDGALLLVIECKYPGVLLVDPSLKINVTVDDVKTSLEFANKLHRSSDEVMVQIINRYGESKPTIKQCGPAPSPVPSSTAIPPPTPSSSVTPIPKDKPGLLKHQTKRLSAEVVLNLLLLFSNSYIFTNSHHHHHSEHYGWNNSPHWCSYSYTSGCSCLSEKKRTIY